LLATVVGMTDTWRTELLEQLEFYWNMHLWPRLDGLTDDEYLWEPVAGCWSLRPGDDGRYRLEQFSPEPPIPPVTTIAWRIAHLGRDVMGKRARALFGPTAAPDDADMYDDRHWPEPLPATAVEALSFLEQAYRLWRDGVAGLDDTALRRPLGPKGAEYAGDSMAALVLHISRETMAHGAEMCLLRDLYRAHRDRTDPLVAACLSGDRDGAARLLADDPASVAELHAGRPQLVAEAAGLRHWEIVRLLLEHGFDASAGSPAPLHYAAAAGDIDQVRFLLEHGGDPAAVDGRFGADPAGWAEFFQRTDVAAFLRSHHT
jgi:hypothetical protein